MATATPSWCCFSPISSPLEEEEEQQGEDKKNDKKKKKKAKAKRRGEVRGEISNLIKQGFMDKSHGGRVSPLFDHSTDRARHSSTLSQMLAKEPITIPHAHLPPPHHPPTNLKRPSLSSPSSPSASLPSSPLPSSSFPSIPPPPPSSPPFFIDKSGSDFRLSLKGRDGRTLLLCLRKKTLVEKSKFFSARLSENRSARQESRSAFEISDCEDVEVFQDSIRLLYCEDPRTRLARYSVSKVLGILKVSSLLLSEACIKSCLEYLEAVPWTEEEEEEVRSVVLNELHLERDAAKDILRRLQPLQDSNSYEETLMHLLEMVLRGKDEKARRQMKALVSRMLREGTTQSFVGKEKLYCACGVSLDALLRLFKRSGEGDEDCREIIREADNLLWLSDILIERQMAEELVMKWAYSKELANLYKGVPTMVRFPVSRVTARLCVGIGKAEIVCPMEVREVLLQTWLPLLLQDFGWIQRCSRKGEGGLDRKVVEEGIGETILTLPLKQQQSFFMAWFDRFSNNADDCPNLHKAFQVWWRRTFLMRTPGFSAEQSTIDR